jgi:peptide-methionine (S)-S-oxide reductase
MRQGADVGTQYRSAIYTVSDHQDVIARRMATSYDAVLRERGIGSVTTEIAPAGPFYYAEEYHQQYLTANPNGYCGIGGTGVACPVGVL